MKTETVKTILIIALTLLAGVLVTCEFKEQAVKTASPQQDTLFLKQWRREKANKLKLIDSCNYQIQLLAQIRDSLNFNLALNKDLLKAYRQKTKDLQAQIKNNLPKDSTQVVYKLIHPLLDTIFSFQQLSDSACDSTINNLQQGLANRDSTIQLYIGITSNLKNIQSQQEIINQLLIEQLNAINKNQKKKARQNKILTGSILILSGITSGFIISNKTN